MPAPLANRFSHFEVEAHLDDWVSWAYANGIDERLIAFLRFRPSCCSTSTRRTIRWPFRARAPGSSRTARCQVRRPPDLLRGALQACVGEAAGIELQAFVDNLDNLPDIDAILRGEPVLVPKEIDLQYAVASALVGRALRAKPTAPPTRSTATSSTTPPLPAARDGRDAGVRHAPRHRPQAVRGAAVSRRGRRSIADVMLYEM
jgi:hypothetical protein